MFPSEKLVDFRVRRGPPECLAEERAQDLLGARGPVESGARFAGQVAHTPAREDILDHGGCSDVQPFYPFVRKPHLSAAGVDAEAAGQVDR